MKQIEKQKNEWEEIQKQKLEAEETICELKQSIHQLAPGKAMMVENVTKKTSFAVNHALSQLDIDILMAGGRLNYIKMGK